MTTPRSSRHRAMRYQAAHARDIIAAGALPEPLKARLQVDLRNALRGGFHVDLEQLELTLARLQCGRP